MKIKLSHIFRIIIGAYFVYIGIVLFTDAYAEHPTNYTALICCSTFFIILGLIYSTQFLRVWFKKMKLQREELAEAKRAEEAEKRYRELHSSDKFRTAPMPNVEEVVRRRTPVFTKVYEDTDMKIIDLGEETENEFKSSVNLDIEEEIKSKAVSDKPTIIKMETEDNIKEETEKNTIQKSEKAESDLSIHIESADKVEMNLKDSSESEKELAINIEIKEEENQTCE